MAVTNTWEKVSINDLLKADPFGQEVLVRYPNESKPQRVMNKEIFFNKIYVDVTPLYNFINDTLVSESTVLRHLLRHLILYWFRLFP